MDKPDFRVLARQLSIVENEANGYETILNNLVQFQPLTLVVGITGPPGAGKSTLIDAMVNQLVKEGKTIGILAVDPSSPFTSGSLLGDRLRMTGHFNNDKVFIRSISSRGALGGLSAKTIEMTELMKAAGFDWVFIETVGVGQNEVEVASVADQTLVVLVPESGDEIQALKSGLMEVATVFAVNKSDRDGAEQFKTTLQKMTHTPVLAVTAAQETGIASLLEVLRKNDQQQTLGRKIDLLANRAYRLIQQKRMKDLNQDELKKTIALHLENEQFNLFKLVADFA